ncbi:ATP-binding protein (plasmid) [Pseudomonas silesiensis]|uniref:ATP-binding protein n=1 Tax=Pseudomonas silesiensis TaxID=1853130 RepID=UPI0030CAE43F
MFIEYDMLARQEEVDRYFGIILTGGPGIGKTHAIMAMRREGDLFARLAVAGKSKEDVGVYPIPELIPGEKEGERGTWVVNQAITESCLIPLLAKNCGDKHGILLIDDVTAADASVQSALLELVQFGRIGEHELGKNIVIAMTGNGISDGAYAIPWSAALTGRSHVIEYQANFDYWMELPCNRNLDPMFVGFLKANPEFFAPSRGDEDLNNKCFDDNNCGPSPRTWTTLGVSSMKKWSGIQNFKPTLLFPQSSTYVSSLQGKKVSTAFTTYAATMMGYPSAEQLFERPEMWAELEPAKRSAKGCVYQIAHSVRHHALMLNDKINEKADFKFTAKVNKEKNELLSKFCSVVAQLMVEDREMGVFCTRYLAQKAIHKEETLVGLLAGIGYGFETADPVLKNADFPSVIKSIREISALMEKS